MYRSKYAQNEERLLSEGKLAVKKLGELSVDLHNRLASKRAWQVKKFRDVQERHDMNAFVMRRRLDELVANELSVQSEKRKIANLSRTLKGVRSILVHSTIHSIIIGDLAATAIKTASGDVKEELDKIQNNVINGADDFNRSREGSTSDSDGHDGPPELSTIESDEEDTVLTGQEVKVKESLCFQHIPKSEDDWGLNFCFT